MYDAFASALGRARPSYVLLAVLLYAASVPLSALRWQAILRGLDQRLTLARLILVNLAAIFVNNVTPAARAAGEVCRVVALAPARVSTLTAAASVAYERLSEIPAILVLVLVAGLSLSRSTSTPILVVLGGCLLAAGAGAVVLRRRTAATAGSPSPLGAIRIAPPALVAGIGFSIAIWALDVMRLRVAAAALDAPIGWPQAAALSAVTVAAGWIPTIGGLGVIEGGLIGGLIAFGVAPPDAAAITTIERGISYGLSTAAGAGALSVLGGRAFWRQIRAAKLRSTNAEL